MGDYLQIFFASIFTNSTGALWYLATFLANGIIVTMFYLLTKVACPRPSVLRNVFFILAFVLLFLVSLDTAGISLITIVDATTRMGVA